MIILAIDPGTTESGWIELYTNDLSIGHKGKDCNHKMLEIIKQTPGDLIAIEMFASYGMPIGKSSIETIRWIGRFEQFIEDNVGGHPMFYTRSQVKMHLCRRTAKINDAVITQAIKDLFPLTGGGKDPSKGTKSQPGPLYGMAGDMWQALALALTAANIRSV